ncbi:MAG: hypothetical protein WA709_05735 [Stellaceae bacterium]
MTRPLCGAVWFLMAIFDRGISHAENPAPRRIDQRRRGYRWRTAV